MRGMVGWVGQNRGRPDAARLISHRVSFQQLVAVLDAVEA